MKIIDKIHQDIEAERPFYSFEFFPPKTPAGLANLTARIERLSRLHPRFVDVTWGAGGSTSDLTMDIVCRTQDVAGLDTMMHLTCTNISRDSLVQTIDRARELGIRNILALRGDPPHGADHWQAVEGGLSYASELVELIRDRHGDWFCIGVAGYPHGHAEAESLQQDLKHLKIKVDAGADFIITQLFYDAQSYERYRALCAEVGVRCPIVPGIMPIHNYRSFRKVTQLCRDVPDSLREGLEEIKSDDQAVRQLGNEVVIDLCQRLLEAGAPGLHFYTLNLEGSVRHILRELKMVPGAVERALPWRRSANENRSISEDVRPIFWANRPASYLARTSEWDEFPNGRWGDSSSPAFGDLSDHHWFHNVISARRRLRWWGREPTEMSDVVDVFVRYCQGEIGATPFSYRPLALESDRIREQLVRLNRVGLLTINSQPRVNGAPSTDPEVGWGGPDGCVYQKAYVEFFLRKEGLDALLGVLELHPMITFHAIDSDGTSISNCDTVTAVTWGVFPGIEVLQPTVVDPASFVVWKDEAFELWHTMWADLYPPDSPSRRLIDSMREELVLVNIVDNDFVAGDLWAVLDEVAEALEQAGLVSPAASS